jgi:hypothetical protein
MKRTMIRVTQVAFVAMAVAVGLFGSVKVSPIAPGSMAIRVDLIAQAHAIIGRPLTPMSYAGVARRSAVGVGVGVGVAVGVGAAAVVAAPACAQVVDIYGRITTVCR